VRESGDVSGYPEHAAFRQALAQNRVYRVQMCTRVEVSYRRHMLMGLRTCLTSGFSHLEVKH